MRNFKLLLLIPVCQLLIACGASDQVDSALGATDADPDIGNPAMSFTPANYDFGNIRASSDSATKAIVVSNSSSKTVYLNSITGDNSHFTILSHNCPMSPLVFSPSQACTVNVKFAPQSGGTLSMGLSINYGIAATTFALYASSSLSGNGVTPLVFPGITSIDQVQCSTMRVNWSQVSGAGAYLIFDATGGSSSLVGSTSATASYTVTNLTAATNYTFKVFATDLLGVVATNTATQTAMTQSAPVITTVSNRTFPSTYLVRSTAMTAIDYNNTVSGTDTNMSYTCTFDQVVDGAVASGSNCSTLPGTASFSTSTGILNWTPSSTALGPYEVKVTGSLYSECPNSKITVFDVKENFVMTNLLGYWDGQFATSLGPQTNSPAATTWKNLTASGASFDGTLSSSSWAASAWSGDGSVANPYSIYIPAGGNRIDFGTSLDSLSTFFFNAWLNPSSITDTNRTILGNGGYSANGFTLKTSSTDASKLELYMGNTGGIAYSTKVTSKSPLGYWRLDETSGTSAADSSGNGLTATIGSGVTLNQSVNVGSGSSFSFNGSGSSFVDVPDNNLIDITGSLSISMWVYPTSSSNYQGLLAKGNGTGGYPYLLSFDSGTLYPSLYLSSSNNVWSNRATIAATLNQWNHIAVTYNNSNGELKYYVNGAAAGSYTVGTTALASTAQDLEIGNMINHAYPFSGRIDEVALFNRVLTPAEAIDLAGVAEHCTSSTSLAANTWYLISGELNDTANTAKLFVNGNLECTVTSSGTLSPGATNLVMGAKSDGSQPWTGKVGMFNFYSSMSTPDLASFFYATVGRYRAVPPIVTTGLVAYYDASKTNGTAYTGSGCTPTSWSDLSTSNMTATLNNFSSCGSTAGWNGDGSSAEPYRLQMTKAISDYVTVPDNNNLDLSGDLTIQVILNPSGTVSNYKGLVAKGNGSPNYGYLLALNDSTWRPTLYLDGANSSWGNMANTALTTGAWNVVTVTFKSSTKALNYYLNGNPDGSYTTSGSTYGTNAAVLEIGSMIGNAYPFEGGIAAVLIYNSTLTPTEVKQNCQAFEARFSGLYCLP